MKVSRERFEQLVSEALDELPDAFRKRLDNVEVIVEEAPPLEVRREFPGLLLGLYQGIPQTRRSVMAMALPDVISIYKRNIERICRTEVEIRTQVRETVMHEIGHHFGLSEDQLRDIEEG